MCRAPRDTGRPETGFGAVLPSADSTEEQTYFQTTDQESFGVGTKTTKTMQRKIKAGNVPPSGGHASRPPDRGISASGATGEVYKQSSDPQRSTDAQRAWMYTADPMIAAMNKKKVASDGAAPIEEQASASPVARDYRRKTTSITQNPKHKDGIFADY